MVKTATIKFPSTASFPSFSSVTSACMTSLSKARITSSAMTLWPITHTLPVVLAPELRKQPTATSPELVVSRLLPPLQLQHSQPEDWQWERVNLLFNKPRGMWELLPQAPMASSPSNREPKQTHCGWEIPVPRHPHLSFGESMEMVTSAS